LASINISPSASPRDPYVHLSGDMETSRNLEMYPPSACVRLSSAWPTFPPSEPLPSNV
jgi:hypothetical protein